MNKKISADEFRESLDRYASDLKANLLLAQSIIASEAEEKGTMKRKWTKSLVLALALILTLGTVAYGVTSLYRTVNWKGETEASAQEPVIDDGIGSMPMSRVLENDDTKTVSYPVSSNVFKASGGQNYVHGGSSPQEMLVPVLDIKMEKYHMETRPAQIALVSMVQKITNLITTMDFIQSDAVSDSIKPATYRIYFISEDNEKISNENIYVADKRDADETKRIFRMRFNFKNKKYDKHKQYYLVVYDDATGIESFRHPVIMDIAFADDFGFGF